MGSRGSYKPHGTTGLPSLVNFRQLPAYLCTDQKVNQNLRTVTGAGWGKHANSLF